MKKEPLVILLGYSIGQIKLIKKIFREIKVVLASDKKKVSYFGYLLHNLYCAMKDLFQEIAKTFENRIEDLSKYHREFLKRMRLDLP